MFVSVIRGRFLPGQAWLDLIIGYNTHVGQSTPSGRILR
jgi:hypothetical protein